MITVTICGVKSKSPGGKSSALSNPESALEFKKKTKKTKDGERVSGEILAVHCHRAKGKEKLS